MPVTLITPAADAPVTLEDVKAWCRIDFTDQDELVESLIAAFGSIYGFLQGAWPFGLVEAIWTLVSLRRWQFARA